MCLQEICPHPPRANHKHSFLKSLFGRTFLGNSPLDDRGITLPAVIVAAVLALAAAAAGVVIYNTIRTRGSDIGSNSEAVAQLGDNFAKDFGLAKEPPSPQPQQPQPLPDIDPSTISITTSSTTIPRRVGSFSITINASGYAPGEAVFATTCISLAGNTSLFHPVLSPCRDGHRSETRSPDLTANSSGSFSHTLTF